MVRDPARISRICKILEKKWKAHPDLRLGQFLSVHVFGYKRDIFYQEDDDTELLLKSMK